MRTDDGLLEWLRELLEPAGKVSVRRMFGAHGVYIDGLFVAVVAEGRVYLKADGETAGAFETAGGAPFVFESRGKTVPTSYWTVPESALDSPADMLPWARRAIAAALRKPAKKSAKKTTGARSTPSASKSRSSPAR